MFLKEIFSSFGILLLFLRKDHIQTLKWLLFFCFSLSIFTGCSGNYAGPLGNREESHTGELLSANRTGVYEKNSFVYSFFRSSQFSSVDKKWLLGATWLSSAFFDTEQVNQFFNFKVPHTTGYRVEYTTLHPYNKNETIQVSGLVLTPPSSHPLPLLVYHRSTILDENQAPGFMPSSLLGIDPLRDGRFMMAFLSMQGYIVLAPDYTGYGSSERIRPPYLYKQSVKRTTEDMLQAATTLLEREKIPFKRDMFVMGYSQGGHGALAFSQDWQYNPWGFKIKALAAGGGPYDLPETMAELLHKKTVLRIPMILLLQAYSYIYGWDLNRIMKKRTYADTISFAFEEGNINKSARKLPTEISSLFNSRFIKAVQRKEDPLVQEALEDNNVYNWEPDFPVFLFHGREDDIVPYENMNKAYRFFRRGRASITKKDCDFKKLDFLLKIAKKLTPKLKNLSKPNHINCNFMFFLEAGDYFSQYRDLPL